MKTIVRFAMWPLAMFMVVVMLVNNSCSNSGQPPKLPPEGYQEEEEEAPPHRNPVFSLYESDGKGAYLVYRNSEKIATFNLGSGRKPLEMRSHNGDCFILISESRRADTTDTSCAPAEIYKNGRRAMVMDDNFKAITFDMDAGHFYVLGRYGDSVYTVYRDGLRALTFPVRRDSKPVDMSVFGQTVYVAEQRGDMVDIYKDNNRMYNLHGVCHDLEVSLRGVYLLTNDTLYLDKSVIMHQYYYRNADKEMYADPTLLAVSDKNLLVGARSSFDKERHTYACVLLNQQPYTTVKPDNQWLGDSELNTRCCGVAISDETMYFVTTKLTPEKRQMQPVTYNYHIDHAESFALQFEDPATRLVKLASD